MAEDSGPFDSILNFRDVATSINLSSGTHLLKPKMLFRSGSIEQCSKRDGERLRINYCINAVIDLQSKPRKFLLSPDEVDKYVPEDTDGVTLGNFLGITYAHTSLDPPAVLAAEHRRLSWYNKLKMQGHFLNENPNAAWGVLNKSSVIPRGLLGQAQDRLDHAGLQIKAVFRILAEPSSYPAIIYCQYGRGYTELITILVLLLLDVSLADVQQDYTRSSIGLSHVHDQIIKYYENKGCGPEWAGYSETWVRDISNYINSIHGSIKNYLRSIGIDELMQETIVSLLKANHPDEEPVKIA